VLGGVGAGGRRPPPHQDKPTQPKKHDPPSLTTSHRERGVNKTRPAQMPVQARCLDSGRLQAGWVHGLAVATQGGGFVTGRGPGRQVGWQQGHVAGNGRRTTYLLCFSAHLSPFSSSEPSQKQHAAMHLVWILTRGEGTEGRVEEGRPREGWCPRTATERVLSSKTWRVLVRER
jgi:hypothetical protein